MHWLPHMSTQYIQQPTSRIFQLPACFWQTSHIPIRKSVPDNQKDHLVSFIRTQAESNIFAEAHVGDQQRKMRDHYDKHATKIPIEPGDIVYVFQTKLCMHYTKTKLLKNFRGLYMVVCFKTPTTVALKQPSDGKILGKTININQLKGYIKAQTSNWDPISGLSDEGDLSEDELADSSLQPPWDITPHQQVGDSTEHLPDILRAETLPMD